MTSKNPKRYLGGHQALAVIVANDLNSNEVSADAVAIEHSENGGFDEDTVHSAQRVDAEAEKGDRAME